MLQLTVAAPGGRKASIECEASATFGDVKARIQETLGVPPDKQKLICNGKERKNAAETLEAAGVTARSKLMLMLAPGYQMPPAPTAEAASAAEAAPAAAAEESEEGEPIDVEGRMPLAAGAASPEDAGGVVHVRQGRNRYHVKVPQGLGGATFGDLADYLVAELLFPPGVPSAELRFLARGKTAERSQPLADGAARETTVMLLFREGFHLASEGANWLREQSAELADAETQIERLAKQIEANFFDAETPLKLHTVGGLIATLKQSVGIIRMRETAMPDLAKFRDRVLKADAILEELRKKAR